MICLDSSVWVEYFSGSVFGQNYARAIDSDESFLVSTLTLYEVYRKVASESGSASALDAVAVIRYGHLVIPVTDGIAIEAAVNSKRHELAMADAIIFTTSELYNATLWTQDKHFKDIEGVKYFPKY